MEAATAAISASPPRPGRQLPGGLVYTTDAQPGIQRLRRGKGFAYRRANGAPLRDDAELTRIRGLAIPPAYRDVWICPRPNGHLQATGIDARGRKQYRYHSRWREERDAEKFEWLGELAALLPRIRRQMARDLVPSEHGRATLLATVVKLLDTTLGRIGNEQYAKENGSYGLTTLCNRHARLDGDRLELAFKGKSGVEHKLEVRDRDVARVVRQCLALKGKSQFPLFRYADGAGRLHSVGSGEVNDYLCAIAGKGRIVSAKDFRTWHATVLALRLVRRAVDRGDGKFTLKKMLGEVAQALGNTPAVCRKSYVHPDVLQFALMAAGNVERAANVLARADREPLPRGAAGLRQDERRLVQFLRGWNNAVITG